MSKVLIAIPVYIDKNPGHRADFLERVNRLYSQTDRGKYDWYIDANGCDEETNQILRESIGNMPGLELNIEQCGGRNAALNRCLEKSRSFGACVFVNDDIDLEPSVFDSISESILDGREKIIATVSAPRKLPSIEEASGPRRNSLSLYAEDVFFSKIAKSTKPVFRGDVFALNPLYLDCFPDVHSDDSYLKFLHLSREGREIPVLEDAVVYRDHEWRASGALSRMVRYFDGRVQLVNYIAQHEPELLSVVGGFGVPRSELVQPRFEEKRSLVRGRAGELPKGMDKFEDEVFVDFYREYADIAMLYMAAKKYESNLSEGNSVLGCEGKNTMWRR